MSFQFSQNLMGDLQFQSPNSSQSLPSTQQIIPPSQNVSQPLTSQSQFSLPQSENLLENQSLDFPPILNPTSNRADPSSQDLKAVRASLSNRNRRCLAREFRTQDSTRVRLLSTSASQIALSRYSADWMTSQSRSPRCWRRDLTICRQKPGNSRVSPRSPVQICVRCWRRFKQQPKKRRIG